MSSLYRKGTCKKCGKEGELTYKPSTGNFRKGTYCASCGEAHIYSMKPVDISCPVSDKGKENLAKLIVQNEQAKEERKQRLK